MAAAYLNEGTLSQGSDYSEQLNLADSSGDPIDLTGASVGSGDDPVAYEALFQIRAGTVDSGAPALVSLTDLDGVVLGDGTVTITIDAETTRAAVSGTNAKKVWAELDITETVSGQVSSYRWSLKVEREYARAED
jgi:hypothetical protein